MQIDGMKHVCMIGGGKSKVLAPVKDKTIDKWVLPISCPEALPYADRAFELHKKIWDVESYCWDGLPDKEKKLAHRKHYRKMLQNATCPVYMHKYYKDIPMSRPFPFKEIVMRFGTYFDNSVSYMLAMAINEGYRKISLYGMEFNEERHKFGKGVCEYFIGLAIGLGISIEISQGSSLMKTYDGLLYGIDEPPEKIIPEWMDDINKEKEAEKEWEEKSKSLEETAIVSGETYKGNE
jgi:hypothetical protein